jgi:Domain of unknown function (DUF1648)
MQPVGLRGVLEAAPWILAFLLAAKLVFSWDKLPDEVASHFSLSGKPNAWMSREGFGAITILACVLMALAVSPGLGRGRRDAPMGLLLGLDMAMLTVVIAFWQAINFNTKGKRLHPWWILAPIIVFALLDLFGRHLPS